MDNAIKTGSAPQRGYFGVGVENISKELNVGNLARSAHAFGASFFFAIAPRVDIRAMRLSDTSGAFDHIPYYQYPDAASLALPRQCSLVGVELVDESIELPSFRHPALLPRAHWLHPLAPMRQAGSAAAQPHPGPDRAARWPRRMPLPTELARQAHAHASQGNACPMRALAPWP